MNSIARIDRKVKHLIEEFGLCCEEFDRANNFTGPSIYFHRKTIKILGGLASPMDALENESFLESLYATLTAWGMHRMGRTVTTKLVEFKDLAKKLKGQKIAISEVASWKIWEPINGRDRAEKIWEIIRALEVSKSETQIVTGSKALHHILPELVPPIDRQFTAKFFFGNSRSFNFRCQGDAFIEIYTGFHEIAKKCRPRIEDRLERGNEGMNTSFTKIIDNAVIGYGLKYPYPGPKTRGDK